MKILVTGATGFVGRHVVRRLLETEHEIIATSAGRSDDRLPDHRRLAYVSFDLNAPLDDVVGTFGKTDAVIHLAWEGLPNYKAMFHIERNLETNYRFLKRLIESGVRNVSVIGTCFEYGKQEGRLSEEMPPKPNTAYGVAKNALREFLEMFRVQTPFRLKWIRLFYMYGEGQGKNSILEQLKAALDRGDVDFNMSGGEQLRDYCPIETVADRIVKIALQDEVQGIVNCAGGKPISIRRLVEEYLAKTGREIRLNLGHYPYNDYEPMAFWADIDKLSSIESVRGGS